MAFPAGEMFSLTPSPTKFYLPLQEEQKISLHGLLVIHVVAQYRRTS